MRSNLHGARGLTHYQALLRELVQHGRVTYAELCARYPDFSLNGFRQAVRVACADGVARLEHRGRRAIIEAGGACPCCGRAL